jgi:hypothetical protein
MPHLTATLCVFLPTLSRAKILTESNTQEIIHSDANNVISENKPVPNTLANLSQNEELDSHITSRAVRFKSTHIL